MAKVNPIKLDKILLELGASTLSGNEIKIFLAWFVDSPNFSACPSLLEKRTGIDKSNIKKIIKSLRDKKVLIPNNSIKLKTGFYIKVYRFGKIPLKPGVKHSYLRGKNSQNEGCSATPIYTNTYTNKYTNSKGKELDNVSVTIEDINSQ